jgi:DNA-binding transcriptional MocR family regulator
MTQYRITGTGATEIAGSVERGISQGGLPTGQALPTVRALAADLAVSPATVALAYRELARRGLIVAAGRRGTRVSGRPPLLTRPSPPLGEGVVDLRSGNPDPALLPRIQGRRIAGPPRLYGQPRHQPELIGLLRRQLEADGIPAAHLGVIGGALDAIERTLQAHLRPGDLVAVEDPGYAGVLDLLAALGLPAEPVQIDERGLLPDALAAALRRGARAVILTPRAQNPLGAALDPSRRRELARVLSRHPGVLVVEDDHASLVAGAPALSLAGGHGGPWAVVRSFSKSLGPDLRLAALAGDPLTVSRVEGRQSLGAGWVSHVLQGLALELLTDPATERLLARATAAYAERRTALLDSLAEAGVRGFSRSGLNVWIPVPEESAAVLGLASAGWAVRAGEPYRLRSRPAIRITVAALSPQDAPRLATDVARWTRNGHDPQA